MASIVERVNVAVALTRTFTTPFERPDRLPKALAVMAPWGTSIAGLAAGAAGRYPNRVAIVDDAGEVTYGELWRRAHGIAAGLEDLGAGPGAKLGLLARNHVGFVESLVAIAATGADAILLNTGFAGPQLADVCEREQISVVIHDDEFAGVVSQAGVTAVDEAGLAALSATHRLVRPPRRAGSVVILTSGTTGRPKGAARSGGPAAIEGIAAVLDAIPLRLGDTQVVPAPVFHAWGLSHLLLGIARCATTVLSRRFDAAVTLRQLAEHDADVLVLVPVMLQRILAAAGTPDAHPTPSLRVIASSGAALGASLATATLDRFGPVLYNLYGSTEVAVATIARPGDLRRHPATAGRPALGVRVEILDDDGNPLPDGETGRIFVGGAMKFEGYTDGGDKEVRRGLVSTGDLGRFVDGMLYVDGRQDDMIVSGGENVFPIEVEELLRQHPAIEDVAVIGVPDDEFGQVLAAFVVAAEGAEIDPSEVRDHVRRQLARHKVPRRVELLDELPRNHAGKVLRRELAERAAADGEPTTSKPTTSKPTTSRGSGPTASARSPRTSSKRSRPPGTRQS